MKFYCYDPESETLWIDEDLTEFDIEQRRKNGIAVGVF